MVFVGTDEIAEANAFVRGQVEIDRSRRLEFLQVRSVGEQTRFERGSGERFIGNDHCRKVFVFIADPFQSVGNLFAVFFRFAQLVYVVSRIFVVQAGVLVFVFSSVLELAGFLPPRKIERVSVRR